MKNQGEVTQTSLPANHDGWTSLASEETAVQGAWTGYSLSDEAVVHLHAPIPDEAYTQGKELSLRDEMMESARHKRTIEDVIALLDAHPLPPDAPRFTRDELHERD